MGQLLPSRDAFRHLHPSEADLAHDFAECLSDDWYIIGGQWIAHVERMPSEIDLLLMHQHHGLHCIEVKSSQLRIKRGEWQQFNRRSGQWHLLSRSPIAQARRSAFALCDALRARSPRLAQIRASFSVALVDTLDFGGQLPLDADRSQYLLESDRDDLEKWLLDSVFASGHSRALTAEDLEEIQNLLLPDLDMDFQPRAHLHRQRQRVEETCLEQIRGLASLDLNDRVVVFGAAGTGKTRLAQMWAREGRRRGESVWLTCYNEPLEGYLAATTTGRHSPHVRRFLHYIQELQDLDIPPEPASFAARDEYWNRFLPPRVLEQLENHHAIWDRIVIDELQDFNSVWLSIIERLVKPGGKILAVADKAQNLYGRDLDWHSLANGWVQAELRRNCRNTRSIAKVLRRLGGAEPAAACIEGDAPTFLTSDPTCQLSEVVSYALTKGSHGYAPHETLVVVQSRQVRDSLLGMLIGSSSISQYIAGGSSTYTCETTRRAKGLEAKHAVVCDPSGSMSVAELYVAIARAQHHLTVIAPASVIDRLDPTRRQRSLS